MTRDDAIAQLKKCLRYLRPRDEEAEKARAGEKWTQVRPFIEHPELLRFMLRDLLGLSCVPWPWDKIRWAIRASYRDCPIVFEDRKLGFLIGFPESMPPSHRGELLKRLTGAMHIVARHLRETAKEKVELGQLTVGNRFKQHDDRYWYFRRRARESYDSEPPPPKTGKSNGWEWTQSFGHIPEWEGGHNTIAMVNEYFSRFEHLAILLLPSVPRFDPAEGRLRDIISANWGRKFAVLFEFKVEHDAKNLYDRLNELKESLRNPLAHGGFLKDAASAWFHHEDIGALPMNIFSGSSTTQWVRSDRYAEVCELFDEVDAFFECHPTLRFGMFAVKAGMDAIFSEESLRELRVLIAAGEKKVVEDYIEWRVGMAETYANYDG